MERPVGTTTRPGRADLGFDETEFELLRGTALDHATGTLPIGRAVARPTARAMFAATATWLTLVFLLCYVALPAIGELTGLHRGLLGTLPVASVAFGATAFVTTVAAAVVRPTLDLRLARDPVLSATAGGLSVWALVHNTSDLLRHFWQMGVTELATFLSFNVVEMFLIGAMLAGFTRSRSIAFALGGGWQVVSMGLFLTLWGLLVG